MSGAGNRMGDGRDMSLINARKVISQVASRFISFLHQFCAVKSIHSQFATAIYICGSSL
jgi:hypothetical protein